MKIVHNGGLIATIGDALDIHQVERFLFTNGFALPFNELELIYTKDEALDVRKKAYKTQSDPLYMEWQFDKTAEKEQVWRDKVAEIKARYPLPVDS
ncbi:hypothetical protein FR932_07025 [Moritella marina ATCC 15381]|uniref:Uncharacterized protein n=1 Tax=Moritella marina ATCC 15381 TaxID=1202962 RepID=A0A5J6WMD4_MORMI|nr:hypothetical protein [Moritella marina]QFI37612.1 hypothetical protein FR932_07025 [Moritella marina ATCC 15381]